MGRDDYERGERAEAEQQAYLARLDRDIRHTPAPSDPLADFRGPDGELGTDADDIEWILDARSAAAEVSDEDRETTTPEAAAEFERRRALEEYDPADDRPTRDEL